MRQDLGPPTNLGVLGALLAEQQHLLQRRRDTLRSVGRSPLSGSELADGLHVGDRQSRDDPITVGRRRALQLLQVLPDAEDADADADAGDDRGDDVLGGECASVQLLAPATVNRSTVNITRKVFTHARRKWKIAIVGEPDWTAHRLEERGELVREIKAGDQEAAIGEKLREGYRDLWRFALASGLRLAECFLRWDQIDWEAGTITVIQKGSRDHTIPLTREMKAILAGCCGHHDDWVFCYIAKRTRDGRERKKRYPVTYEDMKTQWRRYVKGKLDLDLRFHDTRHTRATRLLRDTGNLKAVQRLLGHADIDTTSRFYAHVTIDDVRELLDRDTDSRQKSRRKARGGA